MNAVSSSASRSDEPLLRVEDLEITFRVRGRNVQAVQKVNLTVARGQTVGLVGESGSGKTTIGAAILGLTPVTAGRVYFDGRDITHANRAERRELATRLQVVFQDPFGSMNPQRTIGDTLAEAMRYNEGLPADVMQGRMEQALHDVSMPLTALRRFPGEFSGGQRQRLAIARALVMEPDFIVCDEPTSALDLSVQAQVLNLLARLKETRGLSYLFISHDLPVVRYLSDEIVVLRAGQVVEHGPAKQIVESPQDPYTMALLMAAPADDPDEQRARREARQRLARDAIAT